MSKVISARVSDEVLAAIDRLADSQERSRAWIVNQLVKNAAERQIEFDEFIKVGTDAIERGEFYTQEEMETWVESLKYTRNKAA
jgi:predicted transcriptional regulator